MCNAQLQLPEEALKQLNENKDDLHKSIAENRSNQRIKALVEGKVLITSSPQAVRADLRSSQNAPQIHTVVKDISRTGVGIYFHEQMFPLEQFDLEFQKRLIKCLVVRCRYLGPCCFEVGAKVLKVQSCG